MEVRADLESLLYVMTKLGARFPLTGASPHLAIPLLPPYSF